MTKSAPIRTLDAGQSPGTVPTETLAQQGRSSRQKDAVSPGWPRVLDLRLGAKYISVSYWTLRDLCASGEVPTIRIPNRRIDHGARPNGRGRDYRLGKAATGRQLRRVLIDRLDLDDLVSRWKVRA